ncbi:MAG: asparagine synthase (glutamine-hydrolyzing) [Acidobacteriota bacterium]|nr:asparagine synthase (glutamine-hydrolyzing) [Blastocatellia bacterium]MDW8412977.1 asparagine synthase (glutamine-hydrolyzing) [Acidobacteriota bacterium]
MCGIVGIWGEADRTLLEQMVARVTHRGPDGGGVELVYKGSSGVVGFGHRRLAIIDLSEAGHQPMSYDNSFWITFNGEIYNYRELRQQLRLLGHKFKTATDTEVVLAAYRQWGERCVEYLNGMFAFAIWDNERKLLFLARDRLGIKPLYYADTPKGFAFASEIKALLPTGLKPELDPVALDKYLTFLWVPDPDTIFAGIKKLPPAHRMILHLDGRKAIEEYWDVSFDKDLRLSEREWAEAVLAQMRKSVKSQMVSDVPIGAFLSGGIDSSSIVGIMSEQTRVSTYTVGFNAKELSYDIVPDDLKYARLVAKLFGTDYHEVEVRPQVMELLPRLVWHLDEPIADPAVISSYLICKAARGSLTVMLSGMGGDEVFAGYPRHLAVRLAQIYNLLPGAATLVKWLPASVPGRFNAFFRNLKKLAKSAAKPFRERYLGFGTYFTEQEKQRLYTTQMQEAVRGADAYERHRYYFSRVEQHHWVDQMLYIDLKLFNPCLNLAYTDKTSMAVSLEVRVPLLDHELVELAAKIPAQLKLRRLCGKYILKRALEPLLPRSVIYRRKAGFTAPLRAWLQDDLRELVAEMLSERRLCNRGYFRPEEVRKLITDNELRKEDNSLKILQLLVLEVWHECFLDGKYGFS